MGDFKTLVPLESSAGNFLSSHRADSSSKGGTTLSYHLSPLILLIRDT